MRTTSRTINGVGILNVIGRIDSADIGRRVETAMSAAAAHVVLVNLAAAHCGGVDDLNALVGALLTARQEGGDVRLVHVTHDFAEVPVVVALHTHFDVYDSEYEAALDCSRSWRRLGSPEAA